MTSHPAKPWTIELGERARDRWLLKTVCITAGISLFMAGYFELLHHPSGPVFEMPLTAFDRWISFRPGWVIAYLTLWFYVGLGPGLSRGGRALTHYGLWLGSLSITGLIFFYLWPTRMPRIAGETGDFPGMALLHGVDTAGNACPSMHVAAAVFTVLRIDAVLRFARSPATLRLFNALWCAAIVYSTLATRQHCLWDVAGGAVLGGVFGVASLKWCDVDARP